MRVLGQRIGTQWGPRAMAALGSVCALGLLLACQQSDQPSSELAKPMGFLLQTGKRVTVTGIACEKGKSGDLTLYVDYLSDLPPQSFIEVAPEATEVWHEFRCVAEARGARTVMVRAHDRPRDGEFVSYGFLQEADGTWQKPEVRTLGGGREVLVVRVIKDGEQLFVDYVTSIPTRDVCTLGPEVDDVWAVFLPLAEESGASKVFVSPSDAPVGGGSTSFAITRNPDGSWSRQELCRR